LSATSIAGPAVRRVFFRRRTSSGAVLLALLAASFVGTALISLARLALDGEYRAIEQRIQGARYRHAFRLVPKLAARLEDLQVALLDYLESGWREPDNGLWEMRGPRRHFTHSKVMAWVAFDRMVSAVREGDHLSGDVDRWEAVRDEIFAEICANGYNEEKGSFTQSYGTKELDASLLLIPRVGFLPADDPRVAGTVEAIQRELTQDGLVLRYHPAHVDDGLPGTEGVFIACSFWLVDALNAIGRYDEAVHLFERLLELRNDVGLLSEQWDPVNKRQLGNTPQAFSHFPLVVSGLQLSERRTRRSDTPPR